jgi:hypothetical protein
MRLASLYKFYQSHFGYRSVADRQRIAFGKAVADCMRVLRDVYKDQDLSHVFQYKESPYARQLTLQFLDNLMRMVQERFDNIFKNLIYYEHEIVIDEHYLVQTRKRGLQIASPFLWNQGRKEIIFLTFSAPNNIFQELGVFITLAETLSKKKIPVVGVKEYTYWDITNASECSVASSDVILAPIAAVIKTCNSFMKVKDIS